MASTSAERLRSPQADGSTAGSRSVCDTGDPGPALWIGEGAGSPADARGGSALFHVDTAAGDVRALAEALPFADGRFSDVVLSVAGTVFEGERADRILREVERVTTPSGRFRIRVVGALDPARIARALERIGLEGVRSRSASEGDLWFDGRRESGVDEKTFRELDDGRAATRWNDAMFEFQRTPYDPRTIAGWIFLRRVRWVARRVPTEAASRVLEIGCEAGGLLRHLPDSPRVIGLDLSVAALRVARRELAGRAISLVHADATRPLPFRDREFHVVITSEMLEHCRGPRRVVGEMHRVLRDDGRVLLTVPNERRYLSWKRSLARSPLTRWMLRGIEEGPAAWHVHHDFDRDKLLWLIDGFFEVEHASTIFGTTLAFVLRKARDRR